MLERRHVCFFISFFIFLIHFTSIVVNVAVYSVLPVHHATLPCSTRPISLSFILLAMSLCPPLLLPYLPYFVPAFAMTVTPKSTEFLSLVLLTLVAPHSLRSSHPPFPYSNLPCLPQFLALPLLPCSITFPLILPSWQILTL